MSDEIWSGFKRRGITSGRMDQHYSAARGDVKQYLTSQVSESNSDDSSSILAIPSASQVSLNLVARGRVRNVWNSVIL